MYSAQRRVAWLVVKVSWTWWFNSNRLLCTLLVHFTLLLWFISTCGMLFCCFAKKFLFFSLQHCLEWKITIKWNSISDFFLWVVWRLWPPSCNIYVFGAVLGGSLRSDLSVWTTRAMMSIYLRWSLWLRRYVLKLCKICGDLGTFEW